MAHDRGFTDVGNTAVDREYNARKFTIVTAGEKAGVFDLRGQFLKSVTNLQSINRVNGFAPGSYIVRRQEGNGSYADKYSISISK